MHTYVPVILAAGKGTRMRSTLPKMLHPLVGQPLLAHVLKAVEAIPSEAALAEHADSTSSGDPDSLYSLFPSMIASCAHPPIVVLGHEREQVAAAFGDRCLYAIQAEQLGTGHAVLMAQSLVEVLDPLPQIVLVCCGDTPLIRSEVLASLIAEHCRSQAVVTFLTALTELPSDFGRVVRDEAGQVRKIVEAKCATSEQLQIREVNSAVYCFEGSWLWPTLQALPRSPVGEYYLTDVIAMAAAAQQPIATVQGSLDETIGVNNRQQLAEAERIVRQRILARHMEAGVTIVDPATTYIDEEVEIASDTVILPGTMISGKTKIGSWCRIGPQTTIERSVIGDRCTIRHSVLEETILENDVTIGPFSHCRPGAHLAQGVRMGNFGEVKNSYLGPETDMHHFSYIGDATVGSQVNIAAGVITSNYDGKEKHHTTIGDHAFIGCDTTLVAPVTVGDHAYTGAGAVVTKDVSPHTLVIGIPAHPLRSS